MRPPLPCLAAAGADALSLASRQLEEGLREDPGVGQDPRRRAVEAELSPLLQTLARALG